MLLLAALAVLLVWVTHQSWSGEDVAFYFEPQVPLFLQINALLSNWPVFWRNVTELGDALILFPLCSFLIHQHPRAWVALFAAVPGSALLSWGGKQLAAVPRPASVLDPGQFNILGDVLVARNSLPSGHTITVFAVVTVIAGSILLLQKGKRRVCWLLATFLFASLVGLSRVVVGAHWPFDVVVGAACGILGGISGLLMTSRTTRWWSWWPSPWAKRLWGAAMLVWGAILVYHSLIAERSVLVVPMVAALMAFLVGIRLLLTRQVPAPVDQTARNRLRPITSLQRRAPGSVPPHTPLRD